MGQYLINGSPVDVPNNVKTGADLKRHLQVPPDRTVVVTLVDGSSKTLQDSQVIPADVTEIETPPAFRYGI